VRGDSSGGGFHFSCPRSARLFRSRRDGMFALRGTYHAASRRLARLVDGKGSVR
jgi:hypothetical protein